MGGFLEKCSERSNKEVYRYHQDKDDTGTLYGTQILSRIDDFEEKLRNNHDDHDIDDMDE